MLTISQKLIPYRAWLKNEKESITAAIQRLEAENRQDEADLCKIRLNIISVFETVSAADEQHASSWADFVKRYETRFTTLTAPWSARLAAACAHGDHAVQAIEEEKMTAAKKVQDVFLSVKEQQV